jgi:sec-independent protein translocase protein TatB
MFSLDPEKLFVVLIVALVLLGPDKLPKLARQLGSGWAKIRTFQQRIESEVRESMPDLPSTQDIARIARSPVSYLNSLAASSGEDLVPDPGDPANAAPSDESFPLDRGAPATNGHSAPAPTPAPALGQPVGVPGTQVPADPGMN